MRRATLSLHGRFVDAYLYFDFAWLVSRDGLVRAFDIERYCLEKLNGIGRSAANLFANNQDIAIAQLSENLTRLLDGETVIDVTEADVDDYSYIFQFGFDFKSIFDLKFYYGRAYLSTEKSIQQFTARGRRDLEVSLDGRTSRSKLSEKHVSDRASRQFQCRYGAVSAACGKNGGLLGLGASSDDPEWEIAFDEFTDQSFSIELNSNALSSLRTPTQVELFQAHSDRSLRQKVRSRSEDEGNRDGLELKGVDGRGFEHQAARIRDLINTTGEGVRRVFLFKNTVWVETEGGKLRSVRTAKQDTLVDEPEVGPEFSSPARILSTANTKMGTVVEGDDQVFLRRSGRWNVLVDDQVYSVRGYLNSKRYQNVITAVRRRQVDLITIVT